jgi:hypothetical protein
VKRLVVLAALAACGRVGFDPLADGTTGTSANSDGHPGDGPNDGSITTSHLDGTASACSIAIPVDVNVPKTTSTCSGGTLDCAASGSGSVYFVFTAPTTDGYQFAAYDSGTMNVSSSTTTLNDSCTLVNLGSCAGILGLSLDQNETIYLSVTANSGCELIDFTVTSNSGGG